MALIEVTNAAQHFELDQKQNHRVQQTCLTGGWVLGLWEVGRAAPRILKVASLNESPHGRASNFLRWKHRRRQNIVFWKAETQNKKGSSQQTRQVAVAVRIWTRNSTRWWYLWPGSYFLARCCGMGHDGNSNQWQKVAVEGETDDKRRFSIFWDRTIRPVSSDGTCVQSQIDSRWIRDVLKRTVHTYAAVVRESFQA